MDVAGPAVRTAVVVGLGNPGARYADTRHNLGFRVVDELARRHSFGAVDEFACNALVKAQGALLLVKPQTYMNRSGHALRCLVERHGFTPQDFLVVYDEIHLPLGKLRLRPQGSPGGHRGLESVLESLATDRVPRLRLGIAPAQLPAGSELAEFVLTPFAADELPSVEEMIERAAEACLVWATEGPAVAMQRFNG